MHCVGRARAVETEHEVMQAQFIQCRGEVELCIARRTVVKGEHGGSRAKRYRRESAEVVQRQGGVGVGQVQPVARDRPREMPGQG